MRVLLYILATMFMPVVLLFLTAFLATSSPIFVLPVLAVIYGHAHYSRSFFAASGSKRERIIVFVAAFLLWVLLVYMLLALGGGGEDIFDTLDQPSTTQ